MKRILYFFPLNPVEKSSGSRARALNLLKYFKEREIQVDFISKKDYGLYTPTSINAFENSGLAAHTWILKRKPVKKNLLTYFFSYKLWHLIFRRKLKLVKGSIPNYLTLHLRKQFDAILQHNSYDYIIISYAYWADLLRNNPYTGNAVTILDTHDLLSSQHQQDAGFNKGAALGDELRRLSLFDQVWAISPEETYFFSQFLKEKVKHIPMTISEPPALKIMPEKEFDLIYVATDNPHNLISAAWFFTEVYPLLPDKLSICVIGTIVKHIPAKHNVTSITFADDLNGYYYRSKIALCPMLTGTGVKIKIVEALSHAMPVVCSMRGLDGLPDKTNNGCLATDDPQQFANYINYLLEDKDFYKEQSEWSLACFQKNFAVKQVYKKLDSALTITK